MNFQLFYLTPSYPPLPSERGKLKSLSLGRGVWGEANKITKIVTLIVEKYIAIGMVFGIDNMFPENR